MHPGSQLVLVLVLLSAHRFALIPSCSCQQRVALLVHPRASQVKAEAAASSQQPAARSSQQ
jgi:hypothetical protein